MAPWCPPLPGHRARRTQPPAKATARAPRSRPMPRPSTTMPPSPTASRATTDPLTFDQRREPPDPGGFSFDPGGVPTTSRESGRRGRRRRERDEPAGVDPAGPVVRGPDLGPVVDAMDDRKLEAARERRRRACRIGSSPGRHALWRDPERRREGLSGERMWNGRPPRPHHEGDDPHDQRREEEGEKGPHDPVVALLRAGVPADE